MKKNILFLFLLAPLFAFAQVWDDFSDGDFTQNPAWTGTDANFLINNNLQLQSCATATSTSYLFTPSEAINNAVWQTDVQINYNPSSSNYAVIYLISNEIRPDSCDAYYVQIGGTNDEVSLFVQQGTRKTKIIDGENGRTNLNPVIISIKVTRDEIGNFALYSKKSDEDEYFPEGEVNDTKVLRSNFFGLLYRNSGTTGSAYLFDNVNITGESAPELRPTIKPQFGDIVWNEVMYNVSESLVEYVEIANLTEDTLDIAGMKFATLKTDGTPNTFVEIAPATFILPNSYAAFCTDKANVYNYFNLTEENAKIYNVARWNALNNEGATLVLFDETGTNEFDRFIYSAKMQHPLVENPHNVSLEKINPAMPSFSASSWHSAASEAKYGTPGYKNSQYSDNEKVSRKSKVWLDTEYFSPDNDGNNDVLFIRYAPEAVGTTAKAVIFNAVGERVKTLCNNILLSSEGFLTWDGTTDSGKLANPAVYVLYFQFFNATNGGKTEIKLPVVLTIR
jgi:hypothetical protein